MKGEILLYNLSVEELLKILEQKIPLRVPTLSMSDRQIWYYVGQRSVIDLIKSLIEDDSGEIPDILSKGE